RPERQQRRQQRQAGGDERAERDQQDDRREEDADALRRALVAEAHDLGAGPAVLDLQLGVAGGERPLLDVLQRLEIDVVGALVVVDRGDADAAVLRQAAAGRERAGDGRDGLGGRDALERALDARLR